MAGARRGDAPQRPAPASQDVACAAWHTAQLAGRGVKLAHKRCYGNRRGMAGARFPDGASSAPATWVPQEGQNPRLAGFRCRRSIRGSAAPVISTSSRAKNIGGAPVLFRQSAQRQSNRNGGSAGHRYETFPHQHRPSRFVAAARARRTKEPGRVRRDGWRVTPIPAARKPSTDRWPFARRMPQSGS